MIWNLTEAGRGTVARTRRALVDVSPAHPANTVKAICTLAGGADREVRGHRLPPGREAGTQTFAIDLPEPEAGMPVVWRPVLMRSGRVLDPLRGGVEPEPLAALPSPALPTRALPTPALPNPALPTPALPVPPGRRADHGAASGELPASPRFAFEPRFLFRVSAPFVPDITSSGETPEGVHYFFQLRDGGTVRGPALEARILGRDGDRMRLRPDGIGVADIQATMVTRDGGTVVMTYSGLIDTGPGGYASMLAGTGPKTASIRFAPRYLTAVPSLLWMNRVQAIGIGVADLERLVVEYDIYAFGPADLPV